MKIKEKREIEEMKMENEQNLEEISNKPIVAVRTLNDFLKDELDAGGNEEEEEEKKDEKEDYVFKVNSIKVEKDSDEIMTGYMKKKSYTTWQERYFQLKNGFLYWYKDDKSREAQNFISLIDCKKVTGHKPKKFLMIVRDKVYKFSCETDELKEKWVDSISAEMKKLKIESERKIENVYQVKLKKKIITDMMSLPNITSDVVEITKKIEECLAVENTFMKKEKVVRKTTDLAPNRSLVEKNPSFKEEKLRMNMTDTSSEKTGALGISLLNNKEHKKKHGLFSWCNTLCMCFKKKKTYDEFEATAK